jgi:hypothetical protein
MTTKEKFARSLDREIEAVQQGLQTADEVRERIFEHDWDGLSVSLNELHKASEHISGLEEERDALFRELKEQLEMPKQAGFYAVIVRLPGEEREQLSERYRTLKKAVLQFQGVIWSIDAYTRTMSTTFQEILYSLYPHKRGTMYEKSGRQRATGNDPLVVNKRL